ncbi:Gfo/Idh/MocA family protein [Micromonospora echinofusca]|uniref:Gfo/Idh/MocA family oxidoreductase n=1 Tax=Micromonospora echinofusca TaxID=47858 RepID=A0ABS3VL52_MICEH|nr:Gfo/Idh/MocA family oxidoreductase [Micromonospora echinofusca]MBO4205269.1 Gfo/Idh/MocA family oxidoreductase [Micromonospora echinofusca]
MLRLGIIGAGIMGARVADTAGGLPGVAVTAVADPRREQAARVAAGCGAAAFDDYPDLLRSGLVDAVYVGLPHRWHTAACVAAAAHGVHVLIDKPLCTTVPEAEQIVTARDRSGVTLMVGFSYRFRAEWIRARQAVADGLIGTPEYVSDVIAEADPDTPAWYWAADEGGGIVQLQAHHCFDRLAWLVGSPLTEITCRTVGPAGGAPTAATLSGVLASGAVVGIGLSFGRTHRADARTLCLVQGSAGQLHLDQTRTLTVRTAEAERVESYADDDWLTRQLAAFVDACAGSGGPVPTAEDGHYAVRCAVAAEESARTGRAVRL